MIVKLSHKIVKLLSTFVSVLQKQVRKRKNITRKILQYEIASSDQNE